MSQDRNISASADDSVAHDYHFASDNTSGICPEAWAALAEAGKGRLPSYGTDQWTQQACDLFRALFEKPDAEIFFVFNGTAANSLALASLCQSYHGVICHDYAHVETDECGAPEFFSNGTKLLVATGPNGKLTPCAVEKLILKRTDIHFPKPRVLSLTQGTEWGTVYTVDEIRALTAVAKRHGLAVHMDGARFSNACAALGEHSGGAVTPACITWRAGVDVLCFGGTKNGMFSTEAVVFFNPQIAREFDYRCKQAGQLASKMRLHSGQWVGMLRDGAWLRNAAHANRMTQKLAAELRAIPGTRILVEPEVNALFAELPPAVAQKLMRQGWHFYSFIGAHGYRLMCSWDTRDDDIARFAAALREAM
jgi:threonine aldolase